MSDRSTCDDLIVTVSKLLNDQLAGHEYTHWSREDIECAYAEAVAAVSLVRPDLAVGLVSVELSEGSLQRVPSECLELHKVIGVEDENGNVSETASKSNNNLAKWFPSVCSVDSSGTYTIASYDVDENNPYIFYVQPPVPKGFTGKVLIQCAGGCKDFEIDCRFETPIIEFMLYRLLNTELDSTTSNSAADKHLNNFVTLLGLSYQMKQRLIGGDSSVVTTQQG